MIDCSLRKRSKWMTGWCLSTANTGERSSRKQTYEGINTTGLRPIFCRRQTNWIESLHLARRRTRLRQRQRHNMTEPAAWAKQKWRADRVRQNRLVTFFWVTSRKGPATPRGLLVRIVFKPAILRVFLFLPNWQYQGWTLMVSTRASSYSSSCWLESFIVFSFFTLWIIALVNHGS